MMNLKLIPHTTCKLYQIRLHRNDKKTTEAQRAQRKREKKEIEIIPIQTEMILLGKIKHKTSPLSP